MTYTDCMIDFETLDTTPHAVVLQAGWLFFDRADSNIHGAQDCVMTFDIQKQIDAKRSINADTLKWWSTQNADTFKTMLEGHMFLNGFVEMFTNSWNDHANDETHLWSNGPNFDEPILSNIFRQHNAPPCWNFKKSSCFRTAQVFVPDVLRIYPDYDKAHNALEDCKAQALTIQAIWARHNGG